MDRTAGHPRGEIIPPGATATPRQRLVAELERGAMTARDLSQTLGMPEKEITSHLEHVAKSLKPPRRLVMTPASCHHCGFTFPGRHRLSTPGRCPRCRHEGISPPLFRVEDGGDRT